MRCSVISFVGCTKMLPVSQYNVGCAVVQSGNTGWSSLKCSLPSKNTSQPTVRCISYHFPVHLVRFQANFVFFFAVTHRKIPLQPLGISLLLIGKRHLSTHHWADFENAPLLTYHLKKWLSSPNDIWCWWWTACEGWDEWGHALWKHSIAAAVVLTERRLEITGRKSWRDLP